MKKVNLKREWDFIVAETHKSFKKTNLIKREILFVLQILLSRAETKNYFSLKNIYFKN